MLAVENSLCNRNLYLQKILFVPVDKSLKYPQIFALIGLLLWEAYL